MEFIRDVADWFATGWGDRLGFLFPLGVTGLLALYVLWLVIGYLRASQVGLHEGHAPRQAVPLPSAAEPATLATAPRGVPYCAHDGLQYPLGARFCARCERDLLIECANCDATLSAGDASCYRCGTPVGSADPGAIT